MERPRHAVEDGVFAFGRCIGARVMAVMVYPRSAQLTCAEGVPFLCPRILLVVCERVRRRAERYNRTFPVQVALNLGELQVRKLSEAHEEDREISAP